MRKLVLVQLCVWTALSLGGACTKKQSDDRVAELQRQNQALEAKLAQLEQGSAAKGQATPAAQALPKSLDAFYPPSAQMPVYTARMTAMAMPGEAMIADLLEGEGKNAAASFEAFAAQYKEVREMVPEWTDAFPMEPIEELREALSSGDAKQVMPMVGKVGQVCHNCHVEHMTAVQHKYHWKDTRTFKIEDPISKRELSYAELMHTLSGSLAAVGANLAAGQKEAAQKQLGAFTARFGKLEQTCSYCHSSPRAYFVDQSVKDVIADFGKELAKAKPDPSYLQRLGEQIGRESCFKCHLVHMPAALAKAQHAL